MMWRGWVDDVTQWCVIGVTWGWTWVGLGWRVAGRGLDMVDLGLTWA